MWLRADRHRPVFAERVLVADGLRIVAIADLALKLSAGVESVRLAGECQAPLARQRFEECFIQPRQVADPANAVLCQMLLGLLSDAGNLPHVKRRKERASPPGGTQSMPLGLA